MKKLLSTVSRVPAVLARGRRTNSESLLDFVPAALEIEQSPPNPLGKWLINSICLFFVIAVLWAIFGKIDIVAVAEGTVVPGGQVKTIQASEHSVVQGIHVAEGTQVVQGDALITLDATNAAADLQRLGNELETYRAQLVREQVYSSHLPQLKEAEISTIQQAQKTLQNQLEQAAALGLLPFQRRLLTEYFTDYLADSNLLTQQIGSKQQELHMSQALVRKAEKILPILTERTQSFEKLLHKKLVARAQYLELEQQRIDAEEELALELARIEQIQSQLQELALQQSSLLSKSLYNSLGQQEELSRHIATLEQEHGKALLRSRQQVIRAPISGTVQELVVHTLGAVLQPAQALMQIVPAGAPLEVQAWVLNQDVGFVEEGQPVTIKVSTFNFTKYGAVAGIVTNLSQDAVMDEDKGYRYLTSIDLNSQSLKQSDRELPLRAGMHVVAEVNTGKRNIYEYFIKPIRESLGNSFGER